MSRYRKPLRCWCGKARKPWMFACRRHDTWRQTDLDKGKARAAKMMKIFGW
ncbi:MAG: hypothetical protein V3S43_06265 [Acidimicrobiia bacterium]